MSKFLQTLKTRFTRHPVVGNAIIYGTLFFGAELSQQVLTRRVLVEEPRALDNATLGRYLFYGTTMQGPILTVWYRWLDKMVVGTGMTMVVKKLAIDQCLCVPPLLLIFYVAMAVMERKSNVLEEFQNKFVQTYKNSCMFWLPVQAINFALIPSPFRVIYIGVASFGWVNILCWIKRQDY